MLVFRGDGDIKDFPGNYSQYREWQIDQDKKQVEVQKKEQEIAVAAAAKPKQNKNKISFKDKFEFETLEKEINTLEKRKIELNDFLAQSDLEYSKLEAYSKELGEVSEQLDEKSFRWLELDELING